MKGPNSSALCLHNRCLIRIYFSMGAVVVKFKRFKRKKDFYKAIVISLVIVISLIVLDARMRPLIRTMAASQAKVLSVQAINEAVSEVLMAQNATYENLVTVHKDNDGRVNSVTADVLKLNLLKARISTAVAEKISKIDMKSVSIPIGSIIGGDLFSGRGPRIQVKLTLTGNANAEVFNSFSAAGINQTHHQIVLKVKTSVYVIIPGNNTSTNVETDFVVAETVIVGMVPEAFTNVEIGSLGNLPGADIKDGQMTQK